ncbi:MAG: hypothetical protein NUV70_09005 [Caldiserica bacterium]|nr:hypothetical protein [Caldisericota bacterium]
MKTLCIVPCGKKKIWDKDPKAGPTQARNVYIGPFSQKCREYAEKFYPFSWCILSAKYGFLFPEEIVKGPYDVSFNDKRTNPISQKELSNQVQEKGLASFDRIVILGGKNYVRIIEDLFPQKEVYSPLNGCPGLGFMIKKLNDSLKRGVPL